jgi:ubiquitin C-terminal hydrolase
MKRSTFSELPPVLIFCLNRFAFDVESSRNIKLNHYVSFPDDLDMSEYLKNNDFEQQKPPSDLYKLVGVVIHRGDPNRGHYYSFIKTDIDSKKK